MDLDDMSHTTTTVVTKQVSSHGGQTIVTTGNREWHSGVCACAEDVKSCCFAALCPCCYSALLSNRLGEFCCTAVCAGVVPLRVKVRLMLGIKGTICNDCILSTFCPLCVLCQISRELDSSGWPK